MTFLRNLIPHDLLLEPWIWWIWTPQRKSKSWQFSHFFRPKNMRFFMTFFAISRKSKNTI